jgi:hypothetical protein
MHSTVVKSKWFVVFSVMVLASLVLSACGGASGGASEMKTEVGEGEGEVSIISWAGYIERGETDPAFDWVTEFEKNTSCKVTNKTAATSDEMVALMNEGGFDLVTASGDASNRLISGGRVQALIELLETLAQSLALEHGTQHDDVGAHFEAGDPLKQPAAQLDERRQLGDGASGVLRNVRADCRGENGERGAQDLVGGRGGHGKSELPRPLSNARAPSPRTKFRGLTPLQRTSAERISNFV